jgi:MMP 1-O-methyltransferase
MGSHKGRQLFYSSMAWQRWFFRSEADDWVKQKKQAMMFGRMTRIWNIEMMITAIEAAPGWLTPAEAVLLHQLALGIKGGRHVVELGAYQGRSTIALASARATAGLSAVISVDTFRGSPENQPGGRHHDASLLNIDGILDTYPSFYANMEHNELISYVDVWRMTTSEAACKFVGDIGLLFVDADHSYNGVSLDLQAWLPHLAMGGTVVLHDVGDWAGPTRAAADLLQKGYTRFDQQDTALALRKPYGVDND